MTGFGAVLAFEVADARTADRLCDALHVIVHATSLGGIESTIERRSKLPGQEHVPPGLLRLSVGCEHIDDLWNDLNTALDKQRDRATQHRTTGREPAGSQIPRHQPQRAHRRGPRRRASATGLQNNLICESARCSTEHPTASMTVLCAGPPRGAATLRDR